MQPLAVSRASDIRMKSADDERSAAADAVEENAAPLLQPAGGAHDGAALNRTSSGVMQEAKL